MIIRFLILITLISCTTSKKVPYHRKDWKHWTDSDRNCFDTRQELLKDRSLNSPQVIRKKNRCKVSAGKWDDYYYPEVLNSTEQIDIDHIIPLKHAHDLTGNNWSKNQKEAFANDPENLVITNRKYNRQKGALTIAQWTPRNIEYACKYYRDWMRLKKKYNLPISNEEKRSVDQKKCN